MDDAAGYSGELCAKPQFIICNQVAYINILNLDRKINPRMLICINAT